MNDTEEIVYHKDQMSFDFDSVEEKFYYDSFTGTYFLHAKSERMWWGWRLWGRRTTHGISVDAKFWHYHVSLNTFLF